MRFRSLSRVMLLLTAVFALAASSAWAHKHPSPLGRCHININVSPRQVLEGEPTEVSGVLVCAHHANTGQETVKLYAQVSSGAGAVNVASTTTEADGAYRFVTAPESTNTLFYVLSHGAQSGHERLRVAAAVGLNGPAEGTQIQTGPKNQVTFTGTVNPPSDVGARVILQRQNAVTGNEWHRIAIGTVLAGGTFSITHTFRVPGDASIRVLVRSNGLNLPSESNVLEYEISQAQKPDLTINASEDPINYGQSVTISGVLSGATTSEPLTLLAHAVHQHGYAPVAQISSEANGGYSFPAQSPVNSTLYEVQGAGRKSAALYEAVKDVLTAEASPTSLPAGQAVTFKGTVAPAQEGHVIYLERQDVNGANFHVVQVSYVLAGSSYSIVHSVYVPGMKVFRIDIPGGPGNGRAVSQPFTIQVTPTPASALVPEAPGNTSLPGEGQTTESHGEESAQEGLQSQPGETEVPSGQETPKGSEGTGAGESHKGRGHHGQHPSRHRAR
jgi:hypothetical protein